MTSIATTSSLTETSNISEGTRLPDTALFVWSGVVLAVAVIVGFIVQISSAMMLVTPWYLPVGGTAAALLVAYATFRRRNWQRIGLVAVCLGLACLEWLFVLVLTVLPSYAGPVAAGGAFPAFRAELADGSEIRESFFQQHPATAVVFYQGRWCPFCVTQLRELEAHQAEFERIKVPVLVVSIEDVQTAAQTQKDFPHLVVVSDEQGGLSNAVQLINRGTAPGGKDCAIPTIILVDRSGTVRWLHRPTRFIARPSASELVATIKQYGLDEAGMAGRP